MGSHVPYELTSVTCHPAEVTFPPSQQKLVLDLATPRGCKAELTWRCSEVLPMPNAAYITVAIAINTTVRNKIRTWVIGSGSYWAVACPLFDPFGLPLSLAHPLLSPILNTAYYISSVLHSDSDVLASTDIENGTVFCVLHTTCVDGFTACVHSQSTRLYQIFFAGSACEHLPSAFKVVVGT